MTKTIIFSFFTFFLFLFIGCSSGHVISPDILLNDNQDIQQPSSIIEGEDGSGFLGIYSINIDTSNMTGSIEPLRAVHSTDVLESVDITGFLTSSPCRDCVIIFRLGFNAQNHLLMGLGIRHPFGPGDPLKPPTGKNRLDLHVFNIEGIILTDSPSLISFPSVGINLSTGYLLNPDGYTSYLDPLMDNIYPTQSNAHPYICYFADYSPGNFDISNPNGFEDILNPTGNLVMKMGSDYSVKTYEFNIPQGESLSFGFAVGCTYGISADNYTERLNPVYRCPQFNKKAASEVGVNITANDLERANDATSATFHIEVMDINHSAEVGSDIDQMAHESKVSSISIHIPGITDTVVNNPIPISGCGRFFPLVYEITIHDDYGLTSGYLPCLVKVKDSYPVGQNPNPNLGGNDAMGRNQDGKTLEPLSLPEFATYQYVEIYVKPCTGTSLRDGVTPVDIAVDKTGHSLILYSDLEVWRYDVGYCKGQKWYTANLVTVEEGKGIEVQDDGRSIIIGGECPI